MKALEVGFSIGRSHNPILRGMLGRHPQATSTISQRIRLQRRPENVGSEWDSVWPVRGVSHTRRGDLLAAELQTDSSRFKMPHELAVVVLRSSADSASEMSKLATSADAKDNIDWRP